MGGGDSTLLYVPRYAYALPVWATHSTCAYPYGPPIGHLHIRMGWGDRSDARGGARAANERPEARMRVCACLSVHAGAHTVSLCHILV